MSAAKRSRKANFTYEESRALIEAVLERKTVLFGKLSALLTNSHKESAWKKITEVVNEVSLFNNRSVDDIKAKWKRCKLAAKQSSNHTTKNAKLDKTQTETHIKLNQQILQIIHEEKLLCGSIFNPQPRDTDNVLSIKTSPVSSPAESVQDLMENEAEATDADCLDESVSKNCAVVTNPTNVAKQKKAKGDCSSGGVSKCRQETQQLIKNTNVIIEELRTISEHQMRQILALESFIVMTHNRNNNQFQ